jgi:glycosyltransferase involved in cell wall biosynthesis
LRSSIRDKRIHFAGPTKDVAAALSDLDALLHTSLKPEPFGRVIIEAMAVGTPVIAADAGGPREIIDDDINGLLAKPGDLSDYGRKLRLLVSDADVRDKIIRRAKNTVEQRFTIHRTLQEFNEIVRHGGVRRSPGH